MAMVTADNVVLLTNTTKTEGDIEETGLCAIVQERIRNMCHHNFVQDGIALTSAVTFNGTAGTIVATSSYATAGFAAADEIYVSGSYRNDGYYTIASVTTTTITIASTSTLVTELSGATVTVSLVSWPGDLAFIAAQFVKYDIEDRADKGVGLASQSLGPRSESYTEGGQYGYPKDLLQMLDNHRTPEFF